MREPEVSLELNVGSFQTATTAHVGMAAQVLFLVAVSRCSLTSGVRATFITALCVCVGSRGC